LTRNKSASLYGGIETYVRLKISPRFLDVGLIMIQQTTREEDEKFGWGLCVCVCALLSLSPDSFHLLHLFRRYPSHSIVELRHENVVSTRVYKGDEAWCCFSQTAIPIFVLIIAFIFG
jgi:hypothetical protein